MGENHGCVCYAQIPKEKRHKFDEASEKCIFIGYSFHLKGYKMYSLKTKKVIINHDLIFDENAMWNLDQEEVVKNDLLPINLLKKSVIEVEESEDVEEEEG